MTLTISQFVGLIGTIVAIIGLSIWTGRQVKSAADFASGGGKSGAVIVAGTLMGTLVGGSSTIGTAQLAYTYGFSAWWFTLGGGIGCLILALFFVGPLRRSGCSTLVGMISREFGQNAGMLASVLSSVGIYINILSQLIAATAVLTVIAPNMGTVPELLIAAVLMAIYVTFGGVRGAGIVGIVKLVLLYVAMIGGGLMVLKMVGGIGGFVDMVHGIEQSGNGVNLFSVFARSVAVDGGKGLSLLLGVLTTQTYAQAVLAGKTDRAARTGALISTCMIPPIGIGGILIGLYMRANFPGISAKTALTSFVLTYMPGPLAGIVLGGLLIAVIGSGAGLALGITAVINNDVVKKVTRKFDEPKKNLQFTRLCILAVLFSAALLCTVLGSDMIQDFSYMSMGLRGAVIFAPLCCAIWMPGRVSRKWAIAAIVMGPVLVLLFSTVFSLPYGLDALFAGVAAAIVCCAIGRISDSDGPLPNMA
jgi:SSS family solute:Na+ symporter